jgi:transposase
MDHLYDEVRRLVVDERLSRFEIQKRMDGRLSRSTVADWCRQIIREATRATADNTFRPRRA